MLRFGSDPALHTVCEDIPESNVNNLLDSMWATMYGQKGIGLAAPQIGETKRAIVMHVNGLKLELINPVITKMYGGKTTSKEGCLSYPNKRVSMLRYKQVVIEGYDRNWVWKKRKLKGLAAMCAQHEVDHLNGIT
ncbi:MAG: peptide deformylase, partial [Candidatus Odinarchaeia archaeon]